MCYKLRNEVDKLQSVFKAHSYNVMNYGMAMLKILKQEDEIYRQINDEAFEMALLAHDIGKRLIPDEILNKPDILDPVEKEAIQAHTDLGVKFLDNGKQQILDQCQKSEIDTILDVIAQHHERIDGHGYLQGTHDTEIPVTARICAVANTYDSITSDRPYRDGRKQSVALSIIDIVKGKQLDEQIVNILLADTQWTKAAEPYRIN